MYISKIKLHNFKGFKGDHELIFDKGVNFFVGDNNCGKSSVFEAIDFIRTKKDRDDVITKTILESDEFISVEIEFCGDDLEQLVNEDWLRPAPNQFEGLYWRDTEGESHHRYEPDFVVELEKEIVMVEVKPESEINTPSVQAKKQTAEKYCEIVNKKVGTLGITKHWKYVIVPTERITVTSTIEGLLI
jgi:predicted ATP-dependent endonuclease of OLD family